jgi:uncharacterized protein
MAWLVRLLVALVLGTAAPASAQDASLPARLEALAQQGNAEAAYHLGMIYHLGLEGAARDPRRAFDYFRRAADAGDPLGAYKIGCYYAGQGEGVVDADPELALRYKLIAAEAGYDLAQVEVAQILHDRGEFDRALHWLEAAARQGNMDGVGGAMAYRSKRGPRPDGPRAWLYFEIMQRDLAHMLETTEPAGERPSPEEQATALEQAGAELRRIVLPEEDEEDRARAATLIAQWQEVRSPVSLHADEGLNAARRLVGLPQGGT